MERPEREFESARHYSMNSTTVKRAAGAGNIKTGRQVPKKAFLAKKKKNKRKRGRQDLIVELDKKSPRKRRNPKKEGISKRGSVRIRGKKGRCTSDEGDSRLKGGRRAAIHNYRPPINIPVRRASTESENQLGKAMKKRL